MNTPLINGKFNYPIVSKLLTKFRCKKGNGKAWLLLILCWLCCNSANGQYFDLNQNRKRVNIPFIQARNMVVIKLKINDKGPYNFVLDTGVGLMIITDPSLVDSLNIYNRRTLKLMGLGEGEEFEAYATSPLTISIPGLTSYDVAAAILKKDNFLLSNYAGMPIHGLLGYEFFNNLAVKIDFSDSTITVCRPKDIRLLRKGSKVRITVEDRKPYMVTGVKFTDGKEQKKKLIVDLGAGHPLSLENVIKNNGLPSKFIAANLGVGFTGPINGFISRIERLDIGSYKIRNVLTSFPDKDSSFYNSQMIRRDGNLGFGVLKKFTLLFDYSDSLIYLKPGNKFNEPFEHDMSGLEYYSDGVDFKRVIVSRVEPGSPADQIGIEKDDEIIGINFKPVANMSLDEIDRIFKSGNDRSLLLDVYHEKKIDKVIITLKRRI